MSQIIQPILQLLLFRAGPQDMPASNFSLKLAISVCFITDIFSSMAKLGMNMAAFFSAGQIVVLGTMVYLLLKINNKTERLLQTLFAIFGALALINLASLPFVYDLDYIKDGKLILSSNLVVVGSLQLWFFITVSRVLRDALETRMFRAVLLAFIINNIILLVLSNFAEILGWQGLLQQPS